MQTPSREQATSPPVPIKGLPPPTGVPVPPAAGSSRPGLKDQSAKVLDGADQLIADSRRLLERGRARLRDSQQLLFRCHQQTRAAGATGGRSGGDAPEQVRQLREALGSRDVIGQAKGILMAERRCSEEQAFALLTEISQHTNVKLRDVAAALVSQANRP